MSLIVFRHPLERDGAEDCACCGKPTPFWYEPKDVALCLACADITPATQVPTKRRWLEAQGIVLSEGWVPRVETESERLPTRRIAPHTRTARAA
jgi:hypothetical protein